MFYNQKSSLSGNCVSVVLFVETCQNFKVIRQFSNTYSTPSHSFAHMYISRTFKAHRSLWKRKAATERRWRDNKDKQMTRIKGKNGDEEQNEHSGTWEGWEGQGGELSQKKKWRMRGETMMGTEGGGGGENEGWNKPSGTWDQKKNFCASLTSYLAKETGCQEWTCVFVSMENNAGDWVHLYKIQRIILNIIANTIMSVI